MDEQKTEEETESEDTTPTEDEGNKTETTPLIDIANAAAKRMEDANKETARLQDVQAERDHRIALGGVTEAGQTPEKKEITPEEYAKEVTSGEHNE